MPNTIKHHPHGAIFPCILCFTTWPQPQHKVLSKAHPKFKFHLSPIQQGKPKIEATLVVSSPLGRLIKLKKLIDYFG